MILKNVPLKNYNSFGLNYTADYFISVKSENDIIRFLNEKSAINEPLLILGGGSNILFTGDFKGTIIHPEIEAISIEERDSESVIISAGAGVKWDSLVEWSVASGFSGLENLSLIPGKAGASPVQNIGAYGAEVKDSVFKVRAVSTEDGTIREFSNPDCLFGYRNSIFKGDMKGRYLITRVYYKLNIRPLYNLSYGTLEKEVKKLGNITLSNIREAVIGVRRSKLPDPEVTGNAGSFFKNPVVGREKAEELKNRYPEMPLYEDPSGSIKLAAGWLIDQCGWKGKRSGGAGVHEKQALVIVNYGNATGPEIYNLSEAVKRSVSDSFGVELEREVEIVGTI